MSTVLIIGASRGIGVETVKLVLKAGHSVRAMARSANAIRLHDPELTARVRRRTAKLSLGYREGPNAAVEIGTDIMPVELHQTRVSYVVRLLYPSRYLEVETDRERGRRSY